jgi:hypothetical protein
MAYQMMKGKKDNNEGFPTIPGTIARYSALGLTNEEMSKNPVWVDKTGNDHDLQMKNFAWGGMSGVGGYKFNFKNSSEWGISVVQMKEHNDNRIVINNRLNAVQLSYKGTSIKIVIKLTGVEENNSRLKIYDDIDSSKAQSYNKDGIYEIDYIANDGANYVYFYITAGNYGELDLPITIEQLPLYPGAFIFDGVDDYGTCDNFPILTKEKGYTVVALRQYLVEKSTAYLIANGDSISNTSFIFEGNNYKDTWNFGKPTTIQVSRILATQTSKQYDGVKLNIGTNAEGSNLLQVGKWSKSYSNVAIWELVFLDHDATEEELTKIKDYFVKTYPWLFPDQAWTVVGKTNEDEDRATIANITGNGNDLVCLNLGFIEGSGYNEEGEYAGYLVTDGVDDMITSSVFQMGKDFTIVGDWKFIDNKKSGTGLVKGSSFYIYNTMIGLDLYINSGSVKNSLDGIKSINAACSDGRAYDRNWNEILANTGNVVGSGGTLEVSSSGGRFDRIAFKNLAIYPRILSKEDCIKAYNYLQTLKAK